MAKQHPLLAKRQRNVGREAAQTHPLPRCHGITGRRFKAVDQITRPNKTEFFADDFFQKRIVGFQPSNTVPQRLIFTQPRKYIGLKGFPLLG